MSDDFYTRYYKQLEGYTITKFVGMIKNEADFDSDGFPKFILTAPDGTVINIEVSQDPEGNGGGFLFIGDEE